MRAGQQGIPIATIPVGVRKARHGRNAHHWRCLPTHRHTHRAVYVYSLHITASCPGQRQWPQRNGHANACTACGNHAAVVSLPLLSKKHPAVNSGARSARAPQPATLDTERPWSRSGFKVAHPSPYTPNCQQSMPMLVQRIARDRSMRCTALWHCRGCNFFVILVIYSVSLSTCHFQLVDLGAERKLQRRPRSRSRQH